MRLIPLILTLLATIALASAPGERLQELLEWQPAESRLAPEVDEDKLLLSSYSRFGGTPSDELREKLWVACRKHPDLAGDVVQYLPERPEVFEFVSRNLGRMQGKQTRPWLRRNSRFLRDELVREAAKGTREDVLALVKLDPVKAVPVLKRLEKINGILAAEATFILRPNRSAALQRLLGAVRSSKVPAETRWLLCDTLGNLSWPGQEEDMLALWSDPNLKEVREGNTVYPVLEFWVHQDPNRWIPVMVRFLRHSNRLVHDQAVACLVQFAGENAREDALRPLLPWLSDPRWSSADDRDRLIASLDEISVPEAVPALIAIVSSQQPEQDRHMAAAVLGAYRDERAIPALRAGLARAKDAYGWERKYYLRSLVACGGFTREEQVDALIAFAREEVRSGQKYGLVNNDDVLEGDPVIALGATIAAERGREQHPMAPGQLIPAIVPRLSELEPKVAADLEKLMLEWNSPELEDYLLQQVLSDQASAQVCVKALESKEKLVSRFRPNLEAASHRGAALPALLLDDSASERQILSGSDVAAQRLLLALARIAGRELPLELVSPLASKGDEAARSYLLAQDTPEARQVLNGTGQIFGASGGTLKDFAPSIEADLQKELAGSTGVREIYAMLTTGYYEAYGLFFVRVYDDHADFRWTAGGQSYRTRRLSAEELDQLQKFVKERGTDTWPKLNELGGHSCEYQYVHLTPANGYRVYMYKPWPEGKGAPYHQLTELFKAFAKPPAETRLAVLDRIPGARLWRETEVHMVYGDSQGPLVRLAEPPKLDAALLQGESMQRFGDMFKRGGGWCRLDLTPLAVAPLEEPADLDKDSGYLNSPIWMVESPLGRVRLDSETLYLAKSDGREVLAKGQFAGPVVSDNGRWALVAKSAGQGWLEPNTLVRVDLQTKQVLPVDIPAADTLDAVAYVPTQGFLVVSARDRDVGYRPESRGPETTEFSLVDAATGTVRRAFGQVEPCLALDRRPLQPTGQPGEFWATRPSEQGTELGRFVFKDLYFKPVAFYPDIAVTSDGIWVDEKNRKVYALCEGSLLELPLP